MVGNHPRDWNQRDAQIAKQSIEAPSNPKSCELSIPKSINHPGAARLSHTGLSGRVSQPSKPNRNRCRLRHPLMFRIRRSALLALSPARTPPSRSRACPRQRSSIFSVQAFRQFDPPPTSEVTERTVASLDQSGGLRICGGARGLRKDHANTVTVSAGDTIARPLDFRNYPRADDTEMKLSGSRSFGRHHEFVAGRRAQADAGWRCGQVYASHPCAVAPFASRFRYSRQRVR